MHVYICLYICVFDFNVAFKTLMKTHSSRFFDRISTQISYKKQMSWFENNMIKPCSSTGRRDYIDAYAPKQIHSHPLWRTLPPYPHTQAHTQQPPYPPTPTTRHVYTKHNIRTQILYEYKTHLLTTNFSWRNMLNKFLTSYITSGGKVVICEVCFFNVTSFKYVCA